MMCEREVTMKVLAVAMCVCALGLCEVQYQHPEEWQLWKTEHGKSYGSQRDELERHLVWLSNREYINAHNKNAHVLGFTLAMNHLGDITDSEYEEMLAYQSVDHGNYTKLFNSADYSSNLPDTVDWRTKSAVTDIKNQDQCGASYAFSAIGALEGSWALAHGELVELSEQNIIDCSVPYGNHACQGGNMYNTFLYIVSNDGVDSADSYPFKGKQQSCSYSSSGLGAQMSGSIQISSGSESDLQSAVANVGPVAVAVDASNNAFRYYSSGVYSSSRCYSYSSKLNHAVLVTGYGTYNGKEYWLVKNSWGTNWGMSGYIMMTRNKYNQCGIATDASFPTL